MSEQETLKKKGRGPKLMNVQSIGIDLQQVSRFEKVALNRSLLKKIFTPEEIEYCLSRKHPAQHLAARFAAKEAAIKAYPGKLSYLQVQVEIAGAKPSLRFKVGARAPKALVTLSHSGDYAAAMVALTSSGVR